MMFKSDFIYFVIDDDSAMTPSLIDGSAIGTTASTSASEVVSTATITNFGELSLEF